MPTWQGRYLARDAPDATKKPKTKRKSGMEGRYLKETQDVMVAKDVNTRVEDQSSKTQCFYKYRPEIETPRVETKRVLRRRRREHGKIGLWFIFF